MSGIKFTTSSVTIGDVNFNGGLNSTAGPTSLKNNESSDLQNVDFNKFGSVLKRNGYAALNTSVIETGNGAITAFADGGSSDTTVTSASHGLSNNNIVQITGTTNYDGVYTINSVTTHTFVIETAYVADDATGTWHVSSTIDGLHWYEYDAAGSMTRTLVCQSGNNVLKMDDLDGTWDDITGALTITTGNHADYENFLNEVYVTNGEDAPYKWTGSGDAAAMTVPTGLTKAKYVRQYNNYLFLANVVVSGTSHKSRIYWSNLKDTGTWTASDWIEVSKNDGQEITGIKVLSDKLIIFKTRSIYILSFTGDADIPFILPGGGKTNSSVGCIAPWTIQEMENGIIFLSNDGFYFFDGSNSTKISQKITTTLDSFNTTRFPLAVSAVQKEKNRYLCAFTTSGGTTNNRVVVFDFFNIAWGIYTGMNISAITTVMVSGTQERIYFGDYSGFTYRLDTGADDYPLNVRTAIDAYYYTNWRAYDDYINKKSVTNVRLFYQTSNTVLTFAYSYDFEGGDSYSRTISLATSTDTYGSGVYGTAVYASSGGRIKRIDLTGRGVVIRFKFANAILGEAFQIDALGQLAGLETTA